MGSYFRVTREFLSFCNGKCRRLINHASRHVLIFIITILLLAVDFYYLKNIAGRRLVGLRWWNEVDPQTGDSHWVFESSDPSTKVINPTDSRFFWLAMYGQPLLWTALAVVAIIRFKFIWLTLVGMVLCSIFRSEEACREMLNSSSHCTGIDHYEYTCIFEVR